MNMNMNMNINIIREHNIAHKREEEFGETFGVLLLDGGASDDQIGQRPGDHGGLRLQFPRSALLHLHLRQLALLLQTL